MPNLFVRKLNGLVDLSAKDIAASQHSPGRYSAQLFVEGIMRARVVSMGRRNSTEWVASFSHPPCVISEAHPRKRYGSFERHRSFNLVFVNDWVWVDSGRKLLAKPVLEPVAQKRLLRPRSGL